MKPSLMSFTTLTMVTASTLWIFGGVFIEACAPDCEDTGDLCTVEPPSEAPPPVLDSEQRQEIEDDLER